MSIDRINGDSDANAETVEEKPERPPPTPPDKPGTEGYPSRAESRLGAAAANETSPPATVEKPESKPEAPRPSAQETSGEQDSTAAEDKPESPITTDASEPLRSSDESSGERRGTSPASEDNPGSPSTELASAESDDQKKADQQEQVPEGQASPPDKGVPTRMDTSSAPSDGFNQAEGADPTKSTEDQRQTTDQPQLDTEIPRTKDVLSAAVNNVETDGSAFPAARGADSPDDADSAREDLPATKETAGGDESPNSRLTIDRKQVNKHLDPLGGADTGSDVVGEPWTDPTSDLPPSGEELVKMDDDDKSRPEKIRKKFFEVVSDAHDITGKAANKGHDIFTHPPTGHAETSTAPEVVPAPHDGVNAGDLATGLFVLGTLFGEGMRRGRKKLREWN